MIRTLLCASFGAMTCERRANGRTTTWLGVGDPSLSQLLSTERPYGCNERLPVLRMGSALTGPDGEEAASVHARRVGESVDRHLLQHG